MTRKRLWTCPRCGHRFVTRNMAHACSRYALDQNDADFAALAAEADAVGRQAHRERR